MAYWLTDFKELMKVFIFHKRRWTFFTSSSRKLRLSYDLFMASNNSFLISVFRIVKVIWWKSISYPSFTSARQLKTIRSILHYKVNTCRIFMVFVAFRFLYEMLQVIYLTKIFRNFFRGFRIKITRQYDVIIACWKIIYRKIKPFWELWPQISLLLTLNIFHTLFNCHCLSLRIQSECEKIWTRITPNMDTFYA